MSELRIITNHHRRLMLYWCDLTPAEQGEFDWLDDPDTADFFRFKGQVYCTQEFMRIEHHPNEEFSSWDGYSSDSFFSGILVKYPYLDNEPDYGYDTDRIIVGWYLS